MSDFTGVGFIKLSFVKLQVSSLLWFVQQIVELIVTRDTLMQIRKATFVLSSIYTLQ